MPLFILVRSQARRPSSFLSLSFVLSMCWFLNDRLLNFSFPDRVALLAAQLINPASQNHLLFLFYDFASSLAHIHDLLQAELVKTSAAILAQLFYLFSSFWKSVYKKMQEIFNADYRQCSRIGSSGWCVIFFLRINTVQVIFYFLKKFVWWDCWTQQGR